MLKYAMRIQNIKSIKEKKDKFEKGQRKHVFQYKTTDGSKWYIRYTWKMIK
jgi:hypothetical protein